MTTRGRIIRAACAGIVAIVAIGGRAEGAGWADALFAERAHDFGPVPRGAKVRHPFVLANPLGEAVTIVDVRASCGCTTAKADVRTVPPGGRAVVEAEMDTKNFVDRKATTLYVTVATASGKQAEVRLGVASTILSDIVLNPGTIDFGAVARGEGAKKTLTIDRVGAPGWKAERMVSASKALDFRGTSLVESARGGDRVSYTLTVTLRADAPAGPIRDEIRILTNDRETPSIPILVTAQVRGTLTASPPVLALGRVAASSAAGAQGRFLVRGARPFAILAVEGAGDGFQVAPPDKARKALHVLTVTYRPAPGAPVGDLRRTFRVVTDLPGEPPLELLATLRAGP